jgi:putative endonuclease
MRATKVLGNLGEDTVCLWLKNRGFEVCARNFSTRTGEVDIIAQRDEVLAFIEVKTRTNNYFHTSTVVTRSKQRKIISAAKMYIAKNNVDDKVCRFDVATVSFEQGEPKVEYIESAFCP